jgi:hypothetical protein
MQVKFRKMFIVVAYIHISIDVTKFRSSHNDRFLIAMRIVCSEMDNPLHKIRINAPEFSNIS